MNQLKNKLKTFKLSGMVNSLDERLSYATKNSISYKQLLELLCDDEENNRRDNSYNKRYRQAKLPSHKMLEDFDFTFQPSIDEKRINDLSTCQFITEKRNVVFIGSPGTGKTHLSVGLCIKALAKEFKVLFTSASEMLYQLNISKADNSYYKKLNDYLKPDLLVIDELGFKKLPSYSIDDFFEVISKRYEQGSCIITTNKPFDHWGEIFGDEILSSAILDRIVHYSDIFMVKGKSYRSNNIDNKKEKGVEIME